MAPPEYQYQQQQQQYQYQYQQQPQYQYQQQQQQYPTGAAYPYAGAPYGTGTPGYLPGSYYYHPDGVGAGGLDTIPLPSDAVVHGSSCVTADCVSAGCAVSHATAMEEVGLNNGDYITEITYRYVGEGRGNLMVVDKRSFLWGRLLALLALLGVVAAAVMLWPQEQPVQKSAQLPAAAAALPIEPKNMVCEFWGDPHVRTFDGKYPSFYGEGEYYIIRTNTRNVIIQGRYMGTKYTAGLAATNKIAVSGKFMKDHVLTVGSMEDGPIKIDGKPVLATIPDRYHIEGVGDVVYDTLPDLVDKAADAWERHIVTLDVEGTLKLEVFRWTNYIDLRITMPQPQGQEKIDGGCGNANGDPEDDTTEAIFNRVGSRVPPKELLFKQQVTEVITGVEEKLLDECQENVTKWSHAQAECTKLDDKLKSQGEVHLDETWKKSCVLDICWGDNKHTLHMAKEEGYIPVGDPASDAASASG